MFNRLRIFILLLFTAVLIILVNLSWWLYYDRTEKILDQQLSRRLAAIAETALVSVEPETVEMLVEGDIDAYSEIYGILDRVRLADSLSELFVIDENYNYLSTTSLDSDSTYFLSALNAPYIDSIFYGQSEKVIVTPSYKTGSIYLKTAFAPLLDSDGFPLAVMGVEASVDYFDALADLKNNLYYATFLSLAGSILAGVIFLLYLRRLNRAEQQLHISQSEAYLGRMVAVVSHEVKNPLMIMRASAERLLKKDKSPEGTFIIEEVDRLNNIVTEYLNFTKSGGTLLASEKKEKIYLSEFMTNVKKHFLEKYRDVQVKWLGDDLDPGITLDSYPRSLRQVILNLLINGADACRQAGKPVEVGVTVNKSKDKSITIRVIDHGPGISKKEQKRIFDPFFSTKLSGSGLGLYVSRKIIAEMGGDIVIDSVKDIKTEFVIKIPQNNG